MLRIIVGKNQKLCPVAFCRNPRSPDSHRNRGICSRCKMRNWRSNNPMRYAFANLRDSARRRGILFTLTFAEFANFCGETDYLGTKGSGRGYNTVDRIDRHKGYSADNIQIMEHSLNSGKDSKRGEEPF